MRFALTLVIGLMMAGCPSNTIIRDSKAYRLEALYFKQTVSEQQKALRARLKASCCEDGVFSSARECAKDGELFAVTHIRFSHHYERLMYLAGYIDKDPGDAPKVEIAPVLEGICHE